jgi:CubicO group peptidase (beta-lactamase class C family)
MIFPKAGRMILIRHSFTLLFSIFAFGIVPGALSQPSKGQMDAQVRSFLTSQHVPGAAIAVVKDGQVMNEVLFGYADVQLAVPVQRNTEFQLASVTKVFTTLALMQLQQEGKLRLGDPVSNYVAGLPTAWNGVTLLELANHTSGLPDVIANPNAPLSAEELGRSSSDALQFAERQPPVAAPATQFRYDQTNYLLLQKVVEKASGQNFRAFIAEHVCRGMPATRWGDAREIVIGRASQYTALFNDRIANGTNLYTYPDYLTAAAGLNSNIIDMEYLAASLTTNRLLSFDSLDSMWAPAHNPIGKIIDISKAMDITGVVAPAAGWFYADNSGGEFPRVFMTGGSACSIVVFPKQHLSVVVLTNLQAKDDPLSITESIAKLYFPELKPMF